MSSDEHADEYSRYIVDGAAVAEMKGIIERHQANDFYVASCRPTMMLGSYQPRIQQLLFYP